MAHELLVGIDVRDDDGYRDYRANMKPILSSYGGAFGYDFKVSEVLKSESVVRINRVFTIRFPSAAAKERFFADPAYLSVRQRFYEPSVAGTEIIASYDTSA